MEVKIRDRELKQRENLEREAQNKEQVLYEREEHAYIKTQMAQQRLAEIQWERENKQ